MGWLFFVRSDQIGSNPLQGRVGPAVHLQRPRAKDKGEGIVGSSADLAGVIPLSSTDPSDGALLPSLLGR